MQNRAQPPLGFLPELMSTPPSRSPALQPLRDPFETEDFKQLFLSGAPLLDLRSPIEFDQGAFPTAINLPLMTDEERAQVGTCYKRKGQEAAIALGHSLVSGTTRESRLEEWRRFTELHPDGYLYCFRGGLRSKTVQQWLTESGNPYPRIRGGYKAMRQYLIGVLEKAAVSQGFIVIAGQTGSGKTQALLQMPRAIDLEGLANHRGSAFGNLIDPQPVPINFENALAIELLRLKQSPGPIFLEDECQLIGRIAIPHPLHRRMKQVPFIELQVGFEERVSQVLHDYITDLGSRYTERFGMDGAALHRERLQDDLGKIRRRLGGERHAKVHQLMGRAFDVQARSGDIQAHREWISILLREYYDPMYDYQMSKRLHLKQAQMSPKELIQWSQKKWAKDA